MANRNGQGPENGGPMTGRGLGTCADGVKKVVESVGRARGMGRGLGRGRGPSMGRGLNKAGRGRQHRFFS